MNNQPQHHHASRQEPSVLVLEENTTRHNIAAQNNPNQPQQLAQQGIQKGNPFALGVALLVWCFLVVVMGCSFWMLESSNDVGTNVAWWLSMCAAGLIIAQKSGWLSSMFRSSSRPALQMIVGASMGCLSGFVFGLQVLTSHVQTDGMKDLNLAQLIMRQPMAGVLQNWFSSENGMILPQHKQQWCDLATPRLENYRQLVELEPSSHGVVVFFGLKSKLNELHEQGCISDQEWLLKANDLYNFAASHDNFYQQKLNELSWVPGLGNGEQRKQRVLQSIKISPKNVCEEKALIEGIGILDKDKMFELSKSCNEQFPGDQLATIDSIPIINQFVAEKIATIRPVQQHRPSRKQKSSEGAAATDGTGSLPKRVSADPQP